MWGFWGHAFGLVFSVLDAQCLTMFDSTPSVFSFIVLFLNIFSRLNILRFICPDHTSPASSPWDLAYGNPSSQVLKPEILSGLSTCPCMTPPVDRQILLSVTTTSDQTHCSCHSLSHHLLFFLGYHIRLLTGFPAWSCPIPTPRMPFNPVAWALHVSAQNSPVASLLAQSKSQSPHRGPWGHRLWTPLHSSPWASLVSSNIPVLLPPELFSGFCLCLKCSSFV